MREPRFTTIALPQRKRLDEALARRLLCARLMLRRVLFALVTLALSACAGSNDSLDALTNENARLRARLATLETPEPRFPVGDVFVPRGKRVELGWLDARVHEVRACGAGKVGVAVEIVNRTDRTLDLAALDGKLLDARGNEAPSAFDFEYCVSGHYSVPAGGKTLQWFKFDGQPARADLLELEVVEPRGLARYRLLFALRAATKTPEIRRPPEPPPPVAIAAKAGPLETNFYRFAITDVKICKPPDKPGGVRMVGIEVLLENRSNVEFTIDGAGELRDSRGYVFGSGWAFDRGSCGEPLRHQKLAPGDRVRGFLRPFDVPADAGALLLAYPLRGAHVENHQLRLAVGTLPPPPTKPVAPTVPNSWAAPKRKVAEVAGVQVTVTGLAACSSKLEDGRVLLGVELLVENRSDKPVQIYWSGEIEDKQHYRYRLSPIYQSTGPCNPILNPQKPLEPGAKIRGWLNAFSVPVRARDLRLHYDVHVDAAGQPTAHSVALDIGHLR